MRPLPLEFRKSYILGEDASLKRGELPYCVRSAKVVTFDNVEIFQMLTDGRRMTFSASKTAPPHVGQASPSSPLQKNSEFKIFIIIITGRGHHNHRFIVIIINSSIHQNPQSWSSLTLWWSYQERGQVRPAVLRLRDKSCEISFQYFLWTNKIRWQVRQNMPLDAVWQVLWDEFSIIFFWSSKSMRNHARSYFEKSSV